MKKLTGYFIFTFVMSAFVQNASAGDLEWSGIFRIEGTSIENAILDNSDSKTKEYGLYNLILRPKIVAADGLYINAQIGLNYNLPGNQMGGYFGDGPGNGTGSGSFAEHEDDADIRVNQVYLTWIHDYGSLIAGRAPLQFGLGLSHNAGRGLFDHYADTRDVVGYKMAMGNFYLFPMYANINEGDISGYDDVKEINIHLQYENLESDMEMGLFYQNRKASQAGNHVPIAALGGDPSVEPGEMALKNFNIYYKRNFGTMSFGMEVAQQGGDTGAKTTNGDVIELSGFGVAAEFEYHPAGKSSAYGVKAGFASGDDPNTDDEYEGFIFDRNYDVGMLLFNHGLGQADILQTGILGRTDGGGGSTVNDEADVEAVSNAIYFSPYWRYTWGPKWSATLMVTAAWLDNTEFNIGGVSFDADKSLGYEVDLSFDYRISERIMWTNQFGYLEPGKAWEVDGNFDADAVYGIVSKAAVSF